MPLDSGRSRVADPRLLPGDLFGADIVESLSLPSLADDGGYDKGDLAISAMGVVSAESINFFTGSMGAVETPVSEHVSGVGGTEESGV